MGPDEPDNTIDILMDNIRKKINDDVDVSDAELQRGIDYIRQQQQQRAIAQATGKRPTKPKKPKEPKLTQLDLVPTPPKG